MMGYTKFNHYGSFLKIFVFVFVTAILSCAKPNITMSNIEDLLRGGQGNKCGKPNSPSMKGTCRDSKFGSEERKFYRLDKGLRFFFQVRTIHVESRNFS